MSLRLQISALTCLSFLAIASQSEAQTSPPPSELQAIYACKAKVDAEARLNCYDQAVGRFESAQNSGEVVTISKTQVENVEREAFGFNIPSLPSLGQFFGRNSKTTKPAKENALTAPVKPAETKLAAKTAPEVPKIKKRVKSVIPRSTETDVKKTAELPDIKDTPRTVVPNSKPPRQEGIDSVILDISKTTEFGNNKTRFFFSNGQVWEQTDTRKVRVPKVRNGTPNTAKISKASLGSFFLRVNGKGQAAKVRRVR